jgi:O-antigen/teichoic acid export membrane protein
MQLLRRLRETATALARSIDLDLARSAGVVLGTRLLGAGAQFGLTLALARTLGAEVTGLYYLAFSITSIASIIAKLGLGSAMLRFVSTAFAERDWRRLAGIHRQGVTISGLVSIGLAVAITILAPFFATTVFDKPEAESVIRVAALLIPGQTLLVLYSQILKAVRRPVSATALQGIGPPLLASILLVVSETKNAEAAMAIVLGSTVGFLAMEVVQWISIVGKAGRQWGQFDIRLLMRTALPLMVVSSMWLVITWSDVIIIGILGTSEDVGIYVTAARSAILMQIPLLAIGAIVSPRFAILYSNEDWRGLEQVARNTSLLGTMVALPAFLGIEALAPWLMSLFGASFGAGANALRILAIGQLINVAVGSVGLLLSMSGRERYLQRTMIIAAFANILLNVILIPPFGINGAAIATAVSVGGVNLANTAWVRRKMGIQPFFLFRHLR